MALTRDFKETVAARVRNDPAFAQALLDEAIPLFVNGEPESAKLILRDLVNQKILFSNPYFVYIEEYEVPQGTDFESLQTQAINKVADKFARSLVVNILEGF